MAFSRIRIARLDESSHRKEKDTKSGFDSSIRSNLPGKINLELLPRDPDHEWHLVLRFLRPPRAQTQRIRNRITDSFSAGGEVRLCST